MVLEKIRDTGFSACKGNGPTTVNQHINRHIIRIASRHRAILGAVV